MSAILKELQGKQQELVNQRAAMKDQVENIEKSLGQIGFALQTQEAIMKEQEKADLEAAEQMQRDIEGEVTPSNN